MGRAHGVQYCTGFTFKVVMNDLIGMKLEALHCMVSRPTAYSRGTGFNEAPRDLLGNVRHGGKKASFKLRQDILHVFSQYLPPGLGIQIQSSRYIRSTCCTYIPTGRLVRPKSLRFYAMQS